MHVMYHSCKRQLGSCYFTSPGSYRCEATDLPIQIPLHFTLRGLLNPTFLCNKQKHHIICTFGSTLTLSSSLRVLDVMLFSIFPCWWLQLLSYRLANTTPFFFQGLMQRSLLTNYVTDICSSGKMLSMRFITHGCTIFCWALYITHILYLYCFSCS